MDNLPTMDKPSKHGLGPVAARLLILMGCIWGRMFGEEWGAHTGQG